MDSDIFESNNWTSFQLEKLCSKELVLGPIMVLGKWSVGSELEVEFEVGAGGG